MKSVKFKYCLLIFQLILLSACGPQATPTEAPAGPLLPVPVDLAGPVMAVGSSFLYADGTMLVAVPGGPFTMGNDGPDNLKRQVTLPDFWIYSTKVTNGQYAYCLDTGLCTPPLMADNPTFGDPLHNNDPMVGVTYDQAKAYCAFTNARLPSEAEWEKTARGPFANIHPWGDGAPSCDLLNFGICVGTTTPVTAYFAGESYYHALDMEGNTLEWVADWYQSDYYSTAPADNPQGPEKGRERVVRASAFNSGADQTQAFNRFHSSPDTHRDNLGFRCVVDDPTYFAPFCNYPPTYGTDGIGGAVSGAQPEVKCPKLEIDQDPECIGTSPITYVTFPGQGEGYPDEGACTQDPADPSKYDCTEDGKLVVCGSCTVTVVSDPLCPSGYTYDPELKSCIGTLGPGACLPGFTRGPLVRRTLNSTAAPTPPNSEGVTGQCCSFTPPELPVHLVRGNTVCESQLNSRNLTCHGPFPSCPTGTSFDGENCVSVEIQGFCKVEGIAFRSCTSGGGDVPVCPGVSCGQNYLLDPSTCQCVCNNC